MVTETGMVQMPEEERERAVTITKSMRPMLTEQAIKTITHDLKMAEKLVTEALEEQIDYGQIPGVAGKGLWDPGAAKIMNAFQCYPRHKVLYHEENDQVITWAIEAEIISRETQQIVGAGVGACSTREPKYKYRWVSKEEAKRQGYTDPEIEQLKTKKRKFYQDGKPVADVLEYRVENPDYGEQVNTIFQMSAKRAETDAAKTLPGVSSALRKLFEPPRRDRGSGSGKQSKGKVEDINEDSPRWTTFWNAARDLLGDDYQTKIHQMLGVTSVAEWLKAGKSLDDAIRSISEKLSEEKQYEPSQEKPKRDPATIKSLSVLYQACLHDFKMSPADVVRELGYSSEMDISENPAQAYIKIASARE